MRTEVRLLWLIGVEDRREVQIPVGWLGRDLG
jgi:hypothetical protein